jgi:hypothetical protein
MKLVIMNKINWFMLQFSELTELRDYYQICTDARAQ